jgi:hypothetical protein
MEGIHSVTDTAQENQNTLLKQGKGWRFPGIRNRSQCHNIITTFWMIFSRQMDCLKTTGERGVNM